MAKAQARVVATNGDTTYVDIDVAQVGLNNDGSLAYGMRVGYGGSGRTPITGTFTGTGVSSGYSQIQGRAFNITLSGIFVGTVQLERSFDGGTTYFPLTSNGSATMVFTAPCSEQWIDDEKGVLYRLNCTAYTSGTVTYRISQ